MPNTKLKYCVFIDVLGYKSMVLDDNKPQHQKINILKSIYKNLAPSFQSCIANLSRGLRNEIFIKSFSDSFYLESTNLHPLIYACWRIYNNVFDFYKTYSIDEKYTPLIRGGMVKDWTSMYIDISSLAKGASLDYTNPVGKGVARAYLTSEESFLSGMRLIIAPEIISELDLTKHERPFEYYELTIDNPDAGEIKTTLYVLPITQNEKNKATNLYELLWPDMNSCTFDYIETLKKIRHTFPKQHLRHFTKTAEVLYKALELTDCTDDKIQHFSQTLKDYINEDKT